MTSENSSDDYMDEKSTQNVEDGDIDFSSLSVKEKDDLILEMHAEEMMLKQKELEEEEPKVRKRKPRKSIDQSQKNQYPGFGKVAIKMASAMTFSMVFILIGPIILIMAFIGQAGVTLFGETGDKTWVNALLGILGVGLIIAAWYLFKYLVKD